MHVSFMLTFLVLYKNDDHFLPCKSLHYFSTNYTSKSVWGEGLGRVNNSTPT